MKPEEKITDYLLEVYFNQQYENIVELSYNVYVDLLFNLFLLNDSYYRVGETICK